MASGTFFRYFFQVLFQVFFLIFHLNSFKSRARLWPQVPAGVCEAGGGRRPAVGCESWTSLSWRHTTKHSQAGARAAAAADQ